MSIYLSLIRSFRPLWKSGSVRWLIAKELAYGGLVKIPVNRISPRDPRSPQRLKTNCMIGGDRMNPEAHNYAPNYAKHIRRFIGSSITLVEVGILRGTGLAIWSDLFPTGRIIGLDIDLSHFRINEVALKNSGAFAANNVEVHEFDQFTCNAEIVGKILRGSTIDIFIDDGLHLDKAITNTFLAVLPHLSTQCVCFIEDNNTVVHQLKPLAPDFAVESHDQMTILSRS